MNCEYILLVFCCVLLNLPNNQFPRSGISLVDWDREDLAITKRHRRDVLKHNLVITNFAQLIPEEVRE